MNLARDDCRINAAGLWDPTRTHVRAGEREQHTPASFDLTVDLHRTRSGRQNEGVSPQGVHPHSVSETKSEDRIHGSSQLGTDSARASPPLTRMSANVLASMFATARVGKPGDASLGARALVGARGAFGGGACVAVLCYSYTNRSLLSQ